MFTYFHGYTSETWDALVSRGFIDQSSGIRFLESLLIPEDKKFNIHAAKGTQFYNLIKETKMPMYIDRLQGGCYYEGYPYDMSLVNEYRNILGDNFYGFQMHEWLSNYKSDIGKILENGSIEWNEENIKKAIMERFPGKYLFLESHTAKEMADNGIPETWQEFFEHGVRLFKKRQNYTNGILIPCDSAYLAPKLELENGAKHLMPELGAQTRDTRVQMAYTRGMSRAAGISWGAYYEPWGGEPFSACCYQRDGKNEWGIGDSSDFPFETMGENGGSSRSLQRRIQLYSYISGAQFISEEWGLCNTFYDWNDFEISPYGKIKLEFLDFVKKYPDVGEHQTPIAVVLPKDLMILEGLYDDNGRYMGFETDAGMAEKLRTVRHGIREIFAKVTEMKGHETDIMINSDVPDAFDIIHEDSLNINDYAYLIDLTSNPAFAKSHRNICKIEDASDLAREILGCDVSGNVHWFVNKTSNGNLLTIFNNSGIERTVERGELLLPGCTEVCSVKVKSGSLKKLEGDADISSDNGKYIISVPAGGWFFGAF